MVRYFAALIFLFISLTISVLGQPEKPRLSETSAKALRFFERIEEQDFNAYLKRVRLPRVEETFKAQVLMHLPSEEELSISPGMQKKLTALAPVLSYHERQAVVAIKVIRLRHIFVGLQGRAVLLISDTAFQWLTTAELQATVAHELGHEYFWGELMEARQQKNYEMMREIELRADGIAVITLRHLGLDPTKLISSITTIYSFNQRITSLDRRPYPLPDERSKFIRVMSELVKARDEVKAILAQK